MTKEKILTTIDGVLDNIIEIRHHIHKYPELSQQEINTAHYISSILKKNNIRHECNIAGNGIVAFVGDSASRYALCLRADIDALPITESTGLPYSSQNYGVMHACGHDIHTAILIGSAIILKQFEDELTCIVKIIFEPAEETLGGAKPIIDAGFLEKPHVTHTLGLHVNPSLAVGQIAICFGIMNAASTEIAINVLGNSCHGAHPDEGVDAIFIASQIVIAAQSIIGRLTSPTEPIIITFGTISGGTARNIIAGSCRLTGIIRSLNMNTLNHVKENLKFISENIAISYGGKAIVQLNDSYPPLINDSATTKTLAHVATDCLGESNVIRLEVPSLGTDDFAYFAEKTSACYFDLGTLAKNSKCKETLHSPTYAPDESCIKTGIAIEVLTILKLMEGSQSFE